MKPSTSLLLIAQVVSIAAAPNDTSLTSFTYNGSGCPSGTLTSIFTSSPAASPNTSTLAFTMTNFTALMGPSAPSRSSARRNCQVNLKMEYPPTWQYAFKSITYNGKVELPEGNAQIGSLDYYSGESTQHVCYLPSPLLLRLS